MNERPRCNLFRGRSLEGVPTRDVGAPAPPVKPQDASPHSTENALTMQCSYSKNNSAREGDGMLVVIDSSSCISNLHGDDGGRPIDSQKALLDFHRNKCPSALPSTSKGQRTDTILRRESDSKEELLMIEINLLSDQEISVDVENDSESVVLSYLRDRDLFSDMEGTLVSTTKKSSLLEGVPKLETIQEGENYFSFSKQRNELPTPIKLSDNSLERLFPSYPATPELVSQRSSTSGAEDAYADAIERLHEDHDFLLAAEIGNDALLKIMLTKRGPKFDIQRMDMLGRNALHLAVCSGNVAAIKLLLAAGVNPNVKDDIGMTPLSLCLMRSRSLEITKLLFDHGAIILKSSPMDTGLFLQFVIMSTPTREEVEIMKLLVSKGALVEDPTAPGGRQALHFAAMSNNPELIKVLIAMGADPFLTNDRGETPREIAILFQCKEAMNVLEKIEESKMYRTVTSTKSSESDGSGENVVKGQTTTTAMALVSMRTHLSTTNPSTSVSTINTSESKSTDSSSSHKELSAVNRTGISWKDRITYLD